LTVFFPPAFPLGDERVFCTDAAFPLVIPADFFASDAAFPGAALFVRAGGFTVLTAFVPDFDPEDPETFFFAAIDALQTGQSGRIVPAR
jgi:hypothetical protein